MIFDILLRNRLNFLCITGDVQKAFLQIKVDPKDRDALRLLWYENLNSRTVLQYRFTRVIFGSGPSPYILGATLQKHVSQYAEKYPTTTDELLKNTYVDDIQSGGGQKEELLKFKEEAIKIMKEGGFQLHKWHSNVPEVEAPLNDSGDTLASTVSPSYAKILGVPWNKTEDRLEIGFRKPLKEANDSKWTKRKMLSAINGIFDLLGISAPVIITGKVLYSQACLRKLRWDEELPDDLQKPWKKWLKGMAERPWISIPRSVVNNGVTKIVLHGCRCKQGGRLSCCVHTSLPRHLTSSTEPACSKVEDSTKRLVNSTVGTHCSTHVE